LRSTLTNKTVRPITRLDIAPFIVDRHYAGRFPSISYRYGLFYDEVLEGIITFGTPSSAPLRSGVAGKEYADRVIELNRLSLRNNYKNDASFLISKSLKEMKKIGNWIVISFADISQGHEGTVYKASGFTYAGLSEKRTDWKIKGLEHLHGQTVADEFRGMADRSSLMRAKYGDDFYLLDRPRKHRFIRVIGTKGFVAAASRAIRYQPPPISRAAA
jgi:hypothetical protein